MFFLILKLLFKLCYRLYYYYVIYSVIKIDVIYVKFVLFNLNFKFFLKVFCDGK